MTVFTYLCLIKRSRLWRPFVIHKLICFVVLRYFARNHQCCITKFWQNKWHFYLGRWAFFIYAFLLVDSLHFNFPIWILMKMDFKICLSLIETAIPSLLSWRKMEREFRIWVCKPQYKKCFDLWANGLLYDSTIKMALKTYSRLPVYPAAKLYRSLKAQPISSDAWHLGQIFSKTTRNIKFSAAG